MLQDYLPLLVYDAPPPVYIPLSDEEEALVEGQINRLRASMWSYAGLLRQESTLRAGFFAQEACAAALLRFAEQSKSSRRLIEAQALNRVARAILHSALARAESRGAHFRNDFPQREDKRFQKHSVLASGEDREAGVAFEAWQETRRREL
jgi:aspartate oxidase